MQKLFYLLFFLSFIVGCQPTLNYDYWTTHIHELENKYSECQQNDAPYCVDVKRAAHDVGQLVYEQTTSPESFGKKIIALQDALKKNQNKKTAHSDYDEQLKQLKVMYAVIALHGPE